ncbi:hypothetical protein M9458_046189, partial [Cirrhinus mrigala]
TSSASEDEGSLRRRQAAISAMLAQNLQSPEAPPPPPLPLPLSLMEMAKLSTTARGRPACSPT